jgi:nucleoside-diphosphate-sugar epimerase
VHEDEEGRFSLRVLVTGGAGFIGSHLCARLLEEGYEVICADNFLTGSPHNVASLRAHPRFTLLEQDVTEPFDVRAGAIFHLASPASPVGYMRHPFATIRVNSLGTHCLLEAAQRQGARFLLASTSEVYGDPLIHPQREDYWGNVNPNGPRACYDESKRLAETITTEFQRQYGTDTRIVRLFNTYGPHSQLADGRMVPNFIVQALADQPLTIYGNGQQTRSLCYVSDLVEGLMRAMFAPNTTGEIFNLGNPEEHPVNEYARLISELCGSHTSPIYLQARQDDPVRRQPDISKARRMLGWEPMISLRDGLQQTIAWFRTQHNTSRAHAPLTAGSS